MMGRRFLLPCALALLAASAAAAQQVRAHMEACTEWGRAGNAFGTRNSCDRPISILFMALGDDQHLVERNVAPGAWFGPDAATDLSGGWMFTACPAGYTPNIRFAVENKAAILNSCTTACPRAPTSKPRADPYRSALFFRSAS
ncbi:MAG: hypothetical protein ACXWI1_12575 [Croceibacterium sp.]